MAGTVISSIMAVILAFIMKAPLMLGAHPFWATKVLLIGAPIGIALALLARPAPYRLRLVTLAALTCVAFGVTYYGKTAFAASYAEDHLAGQFWFFGWITTCALATAFSGALRR